MARQDDRRQFSEWRQRLRRFEKVGLTVARFCAREVEGDADVLVRAAKVCGRGPSPRVTPAVFSPVEVDGGGTVTLRFATGVVMELPADRLELIRTVVQAAAGSPKRC